MFRISQCDKYDTLFNNFTNEKNTLLRQMIYRVCKNIILVSFFLSYLTTYSLSDLNSKEWSTECSQDKSTCIIVIKSEIQTNNSDKMQRIATAYIQMGSTKQKKMSLINEESQTYKLSEENKNVPVLFVNLPLNVDLRFKPLIIIDGKNIGKLNFTNCNQVDGCKTNTAIKIDTIDLFKKGKTVSVVMGVYGRKNNMKIDFPLKNFTKSYAKLIKE